MARRVRWALLVLLALLAPPAPAAAADDIGPFGGPTLTQAYPGPKPAPPLGVAWRVNEYPSRYYHLVAGGRLYVVVAYATWRPALLRAYALEDGRTVLWEREIPTYQSTLSYSGGRVYVTDSRCGLHAFAADTGTPLWSRTFPGDDG